MLFFFVMIRRPQSVPLTETLVPYTTRSRAREPGGAAGPVRRARQRAHRQRQRPLLRHGSRQALGAGAAGVGRDRGSGVRPPRADRRSRARSEEHTSELQSLLRILYAVFCLKQKQKKTSKN